MVKMDQQLIECRSDKIVNIPKTLKIKKSEIIMDIEVGKCFARDNKEVYPYWVSFDPNKGHLNYHIVPKNRNIDIEDIKICIENRIKDENLEWIITKKTQGQGCAAGHRWIEVDVAKDSFILAFQTVAFDENNILNCYLDKIQFYKFPKNVDGPNYIDYEKNRLNVLYPKIGNGERIEGINPEYPEQRVIVTNTQLELESSKEEIVEKFVAFIKENTLNLPISMSLEEFVDSCNNYKKPFLEDNVGDSEAKKLADVFTGSCTPCTNKGSLENICFYQKLKKYIDKEGNYKFLQNESIVAKIDAKEPYLENSILNQKWHVLVALLAFLDIASFEEDCKNCKVLEQWNIGKIKEIRIERGKRTPIITTIIGENISNNKRSYPSKLMNKWILAAIENQYLK